MQNVECVDHSQCAIFSFSGASIRAFFAFCPRFSPCAAPSRARVDAAAPALVSHRLCLHPASVQDSFPAQQAGATAFNPGAVHQRPPPLPPSCHINSVSSLISVDLNKIRDCQRPLEVRYACLTELCRRAKLRSLISASPYTNMINCQLPVSPGNRHCWYPSPLC